MLPVHRGPTGSSICSSTTLPALGLGVAACTATSGYTYGMCRATAHQEEYRLTDSISALQIAYVDLHSAEGPIATLGRSAVLKELWIDCPHYCPVSPGSDLCNFHPSTSAENLFSNAYHSTRRLHDGNKPQD